MTIQLLVSVRDAQEALVAAESGADIIDVKEPAQGSLGFAGIATVFDVVNAVAGTVPVSAALGECTEWLNGREHDNPHNTPVALSFVKLGLAELYPDQRPTTVLAGSRAAGDSSVGPVKVVSPSGETWSPLASWITDWNHAREQALKSLCLEADAAASPPCWVAVAYADYQAADAPPIEEVLNAAIASNCSVLLLDTFVKDGKTTLDWVPESQLQQLRLAANYAGLQFAMAGQLTHEHLPIVKNIAPDIFAVRGAVCESSDRRSAISGDKVRQLKERL